MKKVNKLQCTICKAKKGVTPDRLEKLLIGKTLKELIATYECRACRKGPDSKQPKKLVVAKRARKKRKGVVYDTDQEGNKVYPHVYMQYSPSVPYDDTTEEGYRAAHNTSCAKPFLFLDNRRWCNGCPYFPVCSCPSKRWQDEVSGKKLKHGKK